MVMMERFGSPVPRLMSVMKSFQVPVRSIQSGDRILVITDDAMDPLVWQGAMAAIHEKGGEPVLCMWPRLDHHFADPPQMAIEAARGADAIFALTTTALSDASAGSRAMRKACGGPMWLMEEMTVEILTEGGGRANLAEVKEISALGRPGRRNLRPRQENSHFIRGRDRPHRGDWRYAAFLPCRSLGPNPVRAQRKNRKISRWYLALGRSSCGAGAGDGEWNRSLGNNGAICAGPVEASRGADH